MDNEDNQSSAARQLTDICHVAVSWKIVRT